MTPTPQPQNSKEERASPYASLLAIKVGNEVLKEFDKEMSKRKFTYKDFQELQDNYEKVVDDEVLKAKQQGIKLGQEKAIKDVLDIIDKEIFEEGLAKRERVNREWSIVEELEYVKRLIEKAQQK